MYCLNIHSFTIYLVIISIFLQYSIYFKPKYFMIFHSSWIYLSIFLIAYIVYPSLCIRVYFFICLLPQNFLSISNLYFISKYFNSIYYIHLSILQSVYLPTYLGWRLTSWTTYLSIYLSISIYLSLYLSIYL